MREEMIDSFVDLCHSLSVAFAGSTGDLRQLRILVRGIQQYEWHLYQTPIAPSRSDTALAQ
jgi:hypothetical protein